MRLTEIILNRRSIRKYKNDEIPEDKLRKILQAGLMAPSSQNRKPCEFYVIRNRGILKSLSEAKAMGAAMLSECNMAITVLGDGEKADTWIEDCSIALSFMMLEAEEQGVGSCWCQMHLRSSADGKDAEENVRGILHISAKYRIVGVLALGIPEQKPSPHSPYDADWNKVHYF